MLDFNKADRQLSQAELDDFAELMNDKEAKVLIYQYLFPDAIYTGNELITGDIYGSPGSSTHFNLDKNVIKDFNTGESNKLTNAWSRKHGTTPSGTVRGMLDFNKENQQKKQQKNLIQLKPKNLIKQNKKTQPKPEDITKTITYHYYNKTKTKILQTVIRTEYKNGKKDCKPSNPNGKTQKEKSKAPETRPIYNQPNIYNKNTIIYVEGEKCAEALIDHGYPVTCINGGAEADIKKVDWSLISGKKIIIWPDNDQSGQRHAQNLRTYLEKLKCTVTILGIPTGKPQKWDCADARIEEIKELLDPLMHTGPTFDFYTVASINEMEIEEKPIAHGFMYEGDPVVIHGKGGDGKTTLAEDIATYLASIDHQTPDLLNPLKLWGLFKVDKPFYSLFLQTENGIITTQKRAKLRAYQHKPYQQAQKRIYYPNINNNIMTTSQKITDHSFYKWVKNFISYIETSQNHKIDLVFFDPLISFIDGDENDSVRMREALDRVNSLANECKFTPVVIHHDRKDNSEYRGSSAIWDWARSMISLKKEFISEPVQTKTAEGLIKETYQQFPTIKVTHKKSNNFEPFESFYLKLSKNLKYELFKKGELLSDSRLEILSEITEAIKNLGGEASSQSELINEVLKFYPKGVKKDTIKKRIQKAEKEGFFATLWDEENKKKKKYVLNEQKMFGFDGFEQGKVDVP